MADSLNSLVLSLGDDDWLTPPFPPYTLALVKPVGTVGNSLNQGSSSDPTNIIPGGGPWPVQLSNYVNKPVLKTGHGSYTCRQVVDMALNTKTTGYNVADPNGIDNGLSVGECAEITDFQAWLPGGAAVDWTNFVTKSGGVIVRDGAGEITLDPAYLTGTSPAFPGLTTVADVKAALLSSTYVTYSGPRNSTSSAVGGTVTNIILDQYERFIAAVVATGNDDWCLGAEHNSQNDTIGNPGYCQVIYIARELFRRYPSRIAINWRYWLQMFPNGGSLDAGDLLNDLPLSSMLRWPTGFVDRLHPGVVGYRAIAYAVWQWLRGRTGGVWLPPFAEAFVSASSAHTLNGLVYDAGQCLNGTATSWALVGGNQIDFDIASDGKITRKTTATFTDPYQSLVVEARNGVNYTRMLLRVWLGRADTVCEDVLFDTRQALVMPDAPQSANTQKVSFAVAVTMPLGSDGRSYKLLGTESSQSVSLERDATNHIYFYAKNAAGDTIVSLKSTSTVTFGTGVAWINVSVDLVAGTAQLYVNGVSAMTSPTILKTGETINLSRRIVIGAQTVNLSKLLHGSFREFWMCREATIDWSSSARRDEVFNNSTKAAVALPSDGKINGVDPWIWLAGNRADWMWGRNRGSAGAFVGCQKPGPAPVPPVIPPDGTFQPADEASLKHWWNADDLAAGAVTTWTDRIGSLAVTQATSGRRPVCDPGHIDGTYAAVVFDAVDDFLRGTTMGNMPTGSGPGWMLTVATNTLPAADGNTRIVSAYGGNAGGTYRRQGKNGSNTAVAGDGDISTTGSSVRRDWDGEHEAFSIVFTQFDYVATPTPVKTFTLDAENGHGVPSVNGTALNTGTAFNTIGGNNSTNVGNLWGGGVRHRLVGTGILSAAVKAQMIAWFAWETGRTDLLAASDPYKYSRP